MEKMKKFNLTQELKNKILKRDNFTCKKCGFKTEEEGKLEFGYFEKDNSELNIEKIVLLCPICYNYAPEDEKEFSIYVKDRIDGNLLNTFRKTKISLSEATKKGMERIATEGRVISKAPKGYKIIEGKLVIDEENSNIVKQIFEEFATHTISLTKLAKKYGFTTSGIIKLLKNKTYIGKTNFNNKEIQGIHESMISPYLFREVQKKLGVIS
jgi:hypothetical protein